MKTVRRFVTLSFACLVLVHLGLSQSVAAAEPPAEAKADRAAVAESTAETTVEFARDVLPILSANCFACHGPDEAERQGDLRLDVKADTSSIVARLTSEDPSERMPPPDSGKQVKPQEIETIRRWIAEGAEWQRHWAFEPLVQPPGTLDGLVREHLAERGLELQPSASPHRLARRLSLDLIGLPPTPEAADAFAADPTPEAYERMVDQLLESPRFGEHWARMWLDLARYADTKGYEKDLGRTMWPYRDWVIEAFNADMPLDQFTIEQLAGDLLPEPSESQLIATAFHRNTMVNDEGGTDNEEFRVAAVKDRVNTTIQIWMGLTMGCAQCHTHKYDPISHDDYYRFYAIFNQTEDADRSDDAPRIELMSPAQKTQRTELAARVAELKKQLPADEKSDEKAAEKVEEKAESPERQRLRDELAAAEKQLSELNDQIPKLPVLRELPEAKQRETRIHTRGSFLDPGKLVEPAVLDAFHPLPNGDSTSNRAPDRLAVAHWLVSPENPLTPRVWANRIWARLCGRGLVETEEDFGKMGSPPSHPQLLDWLAVEYRDGGWSLKRLLKTIVLSDTYRQTSRVDANLLQIDPANELLTRGARFRLTGEVIRDQSLAVAGLLSAKMGGPSVMPPQPDGLWRSTYSGQEWVNAEGEDRFRRGLYTYLKRTTPYPSFTTFDAGSGEVCTIRRVRTNTPLQALITLNDPVFLEAAAGLAERMVSEASSPQMRAERGLRLALIRPLRAGESESLIRLQQHALERFAAAPEQAEALLAECRVKLDHSGTSPDDSAPSLPAPSLPGQTLPGQTLPGQTEPAEYAAWIVVASAILNLDEFLTRN